MKSLFIKLLLITCLGAHSILAFCFEEIDRFIPALEKKTDSIFERGSLIGVNVAVFNDKQLLWSKSYGIKSLDNPTPIKADTLFSIQSQSKMMTTLATLKYIHEGLVDLNSPLTNYLPNFSVNSAYEASPESLITIRTLLSHKAGFTHEAIIGNNFDPINSTYDAHIQSISDSWLKFPVNQQVSYSNLGIDLVGRVLEVVSGETISTVLNKAVFQPLQMTDTHMSYQQFISSQNACKGHGGGLENFQSPIPFPASGGVYSTMNDMVKYGQYFLNQVDNLYLSDKVLQELYATPFEHAYEEVYIGLAIHKTSIHGIDVYYHDGGGFGFASSTLWIPRLNLGFVYLSNTYDYEMKEAFISSLKDHIVNSRTTPSTQAKSRISNPFVEDQETRPGDLGRHVGTYKIISNGKIVDSLRIHKKGNKLFKNEEPLNEYKPGLFFTDDGECLDLRYPIKTWRNIKIYQQFTDKHE